MGNRSNDDDDDDDTMRNIELKALKLYTRVHVISESLPGITQRRGNVRAESSPIKRLPARADPALELIVQKRNARYMYEEASYSRSTCYVQSTVL